MPRRVCVVTSSRADYSRCKSVCQAILNTPSLELVLVVTGSHLLPQYGYTIQEIETDRLPIAECIPINVEGSSPLAMAISTGIGVEEFARCFDRHEPAVVIAVTDRFETLAVATAAALSNIVVAHIQGGEVTGTIDESVRHAVTKLAHLHFVATEQSKQRVIRMGEDATRVWNVGCPATDLLLQTKGTDRSRGYPFMLQLLHPVTTEYGAFEKQAETVDAACRSQQMTVITVGPNHDAGSIEGVIEPVDYYPMLPHERFVRDMRQAVCMVGNSSAGIREACYFGTPVVNVGTRQNGRERGSNVLDAPINYDAIVQAIKAQIAHGRYLPECLFGDGTAGVQIAKILAEIELPPIQKRITY